MPKALTAHELARALLAGPDLPVWTYTETGEDGARAEQVQTLGPDDRRPYCKAGSDTIAPGPVVIIRGTC